MLIFSLCLLITKNEDDYLTAHIKGIEPMTAKELEEAKQDMEFSNCDNYIEEKFDGTRATLHFYKVDPFINKLFKSMSIEDRALTYEILRGTGFVNGKNRVYDYYTHNTYDIQAASEFIKNEWGTGGHSSLPTLEDFEVSGNYNPKGLSIRIGSFSSPYAEKTFSWNYVSDRIKDLIEDGIYYPQEAYTRCFSRRVSKQTGWYCENTDSLPHLRDICIPELAGTIIDGEMFIPNRPFKDVSSTLNCLYDKAIERQNKLGKIVFHAFDIVYYKGTCVKKLPLYKRKELLKKVVEKVNSPYLKLVDYQSCGSAIDTTPYIETHKDMYDVFYNVSKEAYPYFYNEVSHKDGKDYTLSPKAFYEYIVATGGEGVIIKSKNGKYHHKRGREYLKVKKFLTRELIIMGFTEPTKEYTGIFPNNSWNYWVDENGKRKSLISVKGMKADKLIEIGYTPVTRHWYENQVGQLMLGVVVTKEQLEKIPPKKRGFIINDDGFICMQVCECSGFDDEMRLEFTNNRENYIGSVVEVKANEIFRDTGKLRHPRFLRVRPDKNSDDCVWEDHII